MDFKVSDTTYFMVCNGEKSFDKFDNKINFTTTLVPYKANSKWIPAKIKEMKEVLSDTKKLISEYFSEVPAAPKMKREIVIEDPILEEIRAIEYDPNIQIPAIIMGFKTPSMKSRDAVILDFISTYLSDGPSSKLYKKMVDKNKTAIEVQAISIGHEDYSMYALLALPLGETELSQLISEIEEEVVKIQKNLISEKNYKKLQS